MRTTIQVLASRLSGCSKARTYPYLRAVSQCCCSFLLVTLAAAAAATATATATATAQLQLQTQGRETVAYFELAMMFSRRAVTVRYTATPMAWRGPAW
jgi:hypothetical protein